MGSLGFATKDETAGEKENLKEKVLSALKDHFRPEFLNRIDEIIIFNYLGKEEIKKIVELELEKVAKRLETKRIEVRFSDTAKKLLAERGFDQNLGARPLKRVIQQQVSDPLALQIVSGEMKEGDRIFVDTMDGKIIFQTSQVFAKFEKLRKLEKTVAKQVTN
jgi:ATP-dependent Clp protease ATP-binding subunit ClpA